MPNFLGMEAERSFRSGGKRVSFLYLNNGLAKVFNFACRADAAERQNVFSAAEFAGGDAQHQSVARFSPAGFEFLLAQDHFPLGRLQFYLIAQKNILR